MNLFIAMMSKANYYRRASMHSSLESFPGQVSTIQQGKESEGEFLPGRSMTLSNPEEEFKLFSDLLHITIQKMFFNNQYIYENVGG